MSMKKSAIAAGVAMAAGSVGAQAVGVNVSLLQFYGSMGISSNSLVTGTVTSTGTGGAFNNGGQLFFGHPWTSAVATYYDTHSVTLTWATSQLNGGTVMFGGGTYPTSNTATYQFHLTGYQVAFGLQFAWNGNLNIPVLAVFDCGPTGIAGSACVPVDVGDGTSPSTGNGIDGTAMQVGPFVGANAVFTGTLASGTVVFSGSVPIPAAAWLFGSGLVGLGSVARRRKANKA